LSPNYAKAYYNRGRAYASQENYVQAIRDYDQAIIIDPAYARAYNKRGDAYQALGDSEAAATDFRKSAALGSVEALQKIK